MLSCQNIEHTHRQLVIGSRRLENHQEYCFIAKLHPSSRKFTLFGDVGLQAVELIDFITTTQILVKMKGKYWCIVNTNGQICEIPPKLQTQLTKQDYTSMRAEF